MTAFYHQFRLQFLEHLRMPAYIMASIGFPVIFFLIFAVPEATSKDSANFLLASFLGFAVVGILFLQFAHGLAEERSSPWYTYMRTLPIGGAEFLASRTLVAIAMAVLTAAVLTAVALATTPVQMPAQKWVQLYGLLLLGGFCFALMGMALGMWVTEKVALPLGNLIYLPLSYAGGLWKPPHVLPASVQSLSEYLPTRFYGEMLWATVQGTDLDKNVFWYLAMWSGVFVLIILGSARFRGAPIQ